MPRASARVAGRIRSLEWGARIDGRMLAQAPWIESNAPRSKPSSIPSDTRPTHSYELRVLPRPSPSREPRARGAAEPLRPSPRSDPAPGPHLGAGRLRLHEVRP